MSDPQTARSHLPGRYRQRGERLSLRVVGIGVAILVLAAGAAVRLNMKAQPAVAAAGGAVGPEQVVEIHSAHGASFVPALEGRRPMFILALGSDARPGEPPLRERSDSIHIIGVNFATRQATILGFPRDSWVNIPGHGTAKITTAMSSGGPALTVATIERLTGIRIDFWILTTFQGLTRMVDRLGPLKVRVVRPMHDRYSGANFNPGVNRFHGTQALAFARDRHDVPQGDITRSADQGVLLMAALAKLHQDFKRSAGSLFVWMLTGWRNVHTDLSPAVILNLFLTATQIPLSHVNNRVVPATTGSVGAQSVVFISPGAHAVYADMRADGIAR